MDILHNAGAKGEFYVEQNGGRLARLQYFHSRPGEINVYHTEVDDKLAGRGIGKKLVEATVAYARENNLKILATCRFAKKVIDKTPEFQDVLV
jgi:predicted GNAT family acetyltransferase